MENICNVLVSRRLCSGMCGSNNHAACIIDHNRFEQSKGVGVW